MSEEGPFTDDFVKHMVLATQTQHGIVKYAEAMAQVLAEAGRASAKATGDSPRTAINKWSEIIRRRAEELVGPSLMEKKLEAMREYQSAAPTLSQLAGMEKLLDED